MKISFRKLAALRKRLMAVVTSRQNVHFLHLRKTGGTTIKSALGAHQVTPNSVLYLHPHRITLRDVPRGHRVMFVTRDPVTRFVSGFVSRLRKGAPAHDVAWSAGEELAFSRFKDPNALALALASDHPLHREALEAMNAISHIQCFYWDWFGDEEYLRSRWPDILFIGQVETFDPDFEALKQRLELPAELALPRDSKSTNRNSPQPARIAGLEAAAIQLVKQWYNRDYAFLDCCSAWRRENGGAVARKIRAAGV